MGKGKERAWEEETSGSWEVGRSGVVKREGVGKEMSGRREGVGLGRGRGKEWARKGKRKRGGEGECMDRVYRDGWNDWEIRVH